MLSNDRLGPHSLSATAVQRFLGGFNCSQAVFSAMAPYLGLNEEEALKIASPFGAGLSRRGLVCGAVSGGLMAIGLASGLSQPCTPEEKESLYRLGREFMQKMEAQFGSIDCAGILGHDLSDPEQYQAAREAGVFHTLCPRVVEAAIVNAATLLAGTSPTEA